MFSKTFEECHGSRQNIHVPKAHSHDKARDTGASRPVGIDAVGSIIFISDSHVSPRKGNQKEESRYVSKSRKPPAPFAQVLAMQSQDYDRVSAIESGNQGISNRRETPPKINWEDRAHLISTKRLGEDDIC